MTKDIVTEGVEVNIMDYESDDPIYSKECINYMGKPVIPKMINNICAHWDRTETRSLIYVKKIMIWGVRLSY